jgi:1,4-alpha-glucan branching enzyme
VGLPFPGRWQLVLDTDQGCFGGSDAFAGRPPVVADGPTRQGQPTSAAVDLPPLAVVWIEPMPAGPAAGGLTG